MGKLCPLEVGFSGNTKHGTVKHMLFLNVHLLALLVSQLLVFSAVGWIHNTGNVYVFITCVHYKVLSTEIFHLVEATLHNFSAKLQSKLPSFVLKCTRKIWTATLVDYKTKVHPSFQAFPHCPSPNMSGRGSRWSGLLSWIPRCFLGNSWSLESTCSFLSFA